MFKFRHKKDIHTKHRCTIRLLDDTEVLQCDVKSDQKGQYLLDFVCNALNLVENDYFGLRYVDARSQRHWLDPTRPVMKQVKGLSPIVFCFRVKFYPAEPHHLKGELTRYQIFLQLRRDLLHGRLYCSQSNAALLAAYIIQSELGDYDPEEHLPHYVSEFKLLLKQTPRVEEKVTEMHQTQLRGQLPAVSEINFLRKACLLDTYGVDPHPVKDHKGNAMYLGINHVGLLTFQGSRKTHHFKWPDVQKINYEGKMFIIHLMFSEDARTKKKHLIGFKCPSHGACRHLWKCAVEQRYFFTMSSSSDVPRVTTGGGLFSRGCKFRYSGRVQKEIVEDKRIVQDQPYFQRTLTRPASFRNKVIDEYGISPCDNSYNVTQDCTMTEYTTHSTKNACEAVIENTDVPVKNLKNVHLSEQSKRKHVHKDPINQQVELVQEKATRTITADRIFNDKLSDESNLNTDSESVYSDDENSDVLEFASAKTTQRVESYIPAEGMFLKKRHVLFSSHRLPFHVTVMRVLVLASLFALLLLSCLLVFVMESDSSLFSDIRKLPEMLILRREYYEPAKNYFDEHLNFLLKR